MLHYGQKITCEGQVYTNSYSGKPTTNINYSDIFTELIQATGMTCEYYASDLYYTLTAIEKAVQNFENDVLYVGIRDSGVDGNTFVKSRLENSSTYGTNNYIKMYRLEIKSYNDLQTMELLRVSEHDVRNELGIK